MTDQTLRIGTDDVHRIAAPSLAASHVPHVESPRGIRHAVPHGTDTALCGYEPRYVFDATSWPGMPGRDGFACDDCRALAPRA